MIITIAGQAGSGKSSVAKALAERLGYRHFSGGDFRRKLAHEKGLTIAGLNKLGEEDSFTDMDVDRFQEELGKKEDNFVVDGRMSFHFIPHSVKVYLEADLEVRAKRVFEDERKVEKFKDPEGAKQALAEREKSDVRRYKKYYGIDVYNKRHFDLVIDTTNIGIDEVVEKIIAFLRGKGKI